MTASLRLKATLPCHGHVTSVPAGATAADRKCPVCQCWWRVDTRLLRETEGVRMDEVTLTRIGVLKK